ncbi:MAG: TadE family protein [Lachnospiraceae bacterium]
MKKGRMQMYMRKRKKYCRGSMTVEMSFLMPIILLMIMGSILAAFYFHDKNVIAGAAYETVVVGSTKMREKDQITENEMVKLFQERVKKKSILLSDINAIATISENEIQINVIARNGKFRLSVMKKAAVTEPENHIRNIRRLKEITDGAKNND